MKIKNLKSIFLACSACLASCNGLPPGEAPSGSIIKADIVRKTQHGQKEAIDIMITSVATGCPPVAAGSLPRVSNEFTVSDGAVNYMPMDVWQSLAAMKLISPVVPGDESSAEYLLTSAFSEKEEKDGFIQYTWKMRMLPADGGSPEIWMKNIEFIVVPPEK